MAVNNTMNHNKLMKNVSMFACAFIYFLITSFPFFGIEVLNLKNNYFHTFLMVNILLLTF